MIDFPPEAEASSIKVTADTSIGCYLLPDGELRVGMSGPIRLFNYSKNWLRDLETKHPKKLEALRNAGFEGSIRAAFVSSKQEPGWREIATISIKDFTILTTFEAFCEGDKSAIALMASFFLEGLESRLYAKFGLSPVSAKDKQRSLETHQSEFFAGIYEQYDYYW